MLCAKPPYIGLLIIARIYMVIVKYNVMCVTSFENNIIVMHTNAPGHNIIFTAFVFLPLACHCFLVYNFLSCTMAGHVTDSHRVKAQWHRSIAYSV